MASLVVGQKLLFFIEGHDFDFLSPSLVIFFWIKKSIHIFEFLPFFGVVRVEIVQEAPNIAKILEYGHFGIASHEKLRLCLFIRRSNIVG